MFVSAHGSAKVVIGFAEALSAPEVAWSLVDAGHQVVAFGRRGRPAALRCSKHVEVHEITAPESDAGAAAVELERLLESQERQGSGARVVFPLDDASLWLCTRATVRPGWSFAGPPAESASFGLDKRRQVELALAAGFRVPASAFVSDPGELSGRIREFPVILRPSQAAIPDGNRLRKGRNWICCDPEELRRASAAWSGKGELLVQPYIRGIGEGVFGLATDAGITGLSAHRRVRMMNPHGSGSSACRSQPVSPELRTLVEKLVAASRWRGLFMVELLRDDHGGVWFVEFNGRPWGSMALSRRQGFEYPAWEVARLLEGSAPTGPDRTPPPTLCRNVGREFMHLLFVLRGPKSRALRDWPKFWRSLRDVVAFRSGDTVYNWRRDDPWVFFADCWNTLSANFARSNR